MPQNRPIEFWRKVRSVVEAGLSLQKAAKQFGVSRSQMCYRAKVEGWKLVYRGRPRTMDLPNGERRAELAKEEAQYDVLQSELERESRVLVIDVEKAQLLAQRVMATHSTVLKTRFSELLVKTTDELQFGEMKPRDRAIGLVALQKVAEALYGWEAERQRAAELSFNPHQAVNLELQRTPPDKLKYYRPGRRWEDVEAEMKLKERARGSLETEHSAAKDGIMEDGTLAAGHAQPPAATHGRSIPQKEAPPLPVKQPGKSEPTSSLRPVQTKQDSQSDPLPAGHPASSTSVSEAEARQEAFEQLRAEHRRACRLKYG